MPDPIELTLRHQMNGRDERNLLDHTVQGIVGSPLDRPEGPLKVRGTATYADEDHPDGTVHGVLARATIARGWVVGMNTAEVRAMPGVLEVACVGVPDKNSGEAVKLYIVKKDADLTSEQVMAFCKEQFTGYKRPKYVEFRETLPKTNVGKILRRELREKK